MGEPTDLYERLYFHEIEVREQLNSRLQLPLSLIVVLVGTFAYLLQSADNSLTSYLSLAFETALGLMGIALMCSAYLFARAAWGHNYKLVPYANQTAQSWKQLTEYDAKHGTAIADRTMAEYLKGHFIEGATANARNNDLRSTYLHRSNMAVIATSAFALLAFLVFALGDLGRKQNVTQVSIVHPVDVQGIEIPNKFIVVPDERSAPNSVNAARVPSSTLAGERNDSTQRSTPSTAPSAADAPSSGRGQTSATTPTDTAASEVAK